MAIVAVVGSENPVKCQAVRSVLAANFPGEDVRLVAHAAPSQAPKQPLSGQEVFHGAKMRAANVRGWYLGAHPPARGDAAALRLFIGIEAGLVAAPQAATGYLAYSACVILDGWGHMGVGTGPGWEYPPHVVRALLKDPETELAEVMGEISGDPDIRKKEGAVGYYSQSRVTRLDLARQGVQMALIPFLHPGDYF